MFACSKHLAWWWVLVVGGVGVGVVIGEYWWALEIRLVGRPIDHREIER